LLTITLQNKTASRLKTGLFSFLGWYHAGRSYDEASLKLKLVLDQRRDYENFLMLGLTATAYRADQINLGVMFPEILERGGQVTYFYGTLQAIRDKFLCPFNAYLLETGHDISSF
jgi:hypothetical protein